MRKIENTEMLNKLLEISVANYYFYTKDGMEYYSGTLSSHQLTNEAGDPEEAKGGVNNDTYYTIVQQAHGQGYGVGRVPRVRLQSAQLGQGEKLHN